MLKQGDDGDAALVQFLVRSRLAHDPGGASVMTTTLEQTETYIGDGLYFVFDGWGITLRAPRSDADHFVYLEPEVLKQLELLVADIRKQGGLK